MTTLYVHAGTQKAGSKAIQYSCTANEERLSLMGLRYASSGRQGSWHRPLYDDPEKVLLELQVELGESNESVIVSYEEIYLWPDPTIETLVSLVDEVKVLIVRRDPTQWLNSFVNQLIKAHRVSIEEIERVLSSSDDLESRLDVTGHRDRWAAQIGVDAVTLLDYPSRGQGDVRPLFLRWIGVEASGLASFSLAETNPNRAADLESLRVLVGVKERLRSRPADELQHAMGIAHERLDRKWIDTRAAAGPRLFDAEVGKQQGMTDIDLGALLGRPSSAELVLVEQVLVASDQSSHR